MFSGWASGGSAVVTTPSDAEISTGFVPFSAISAGILNWLLKNFGTRTFGDLGDAIGAMDPGEVFQLAPTVLTPPLQTEASHTSANSVTALCSTGRYVIYWRDGTTSQIRVRSRDLGTLIGTMTTANVPTAFRRLTCYANTVLAVYDTYVEAFDIDTLSSLWIYDHGAALRDAACNGTRVLAVGDTSGGFEVRQLIRSSGALDNSYAHGAAVLACARGLDTEQWVIYGNAGTSTATQAYISMQTPGGSETWGAARSTPPHGGTVATDGKHAYFAATAAASTDTIEKVSLGDGLLVASYNSADDYNYLDVDHGIVIVGSSSDTSVRIHDKQSLGLVASLGTSGAVIPVCCGGQSLYVGDATSLRRRSRGAYNRIRSWLAVSVGSTLSPYPWRAIPTE